MTDEQEQPKETAEVPTPPPVRPKRAPETIRIQSSNPIPPGRVDVAPVGRSRGLDGRTRAVIAAAVIAVMLAGIGISLLRSGDDPQASAPVAAASDGSDRKDRFIARGDKLCKRSSRAQERLLHPGSPDEFQAYLTDVRGIVVGLINDLKRLPRPQADRRLLGRMFDEIEKLPPLLNEARAAAAAGDLGGVERTIARAEKIEHQANSLALQYGFVECSQP